ncbi:MAG: polyprenyl synthetase family protein [Lachnospiraceae bacterium]|nr:polyprenyl synthetase family protein [Candidatus Merdinaster equi]
MKEEQSKLLEDKAKQIEDIIKQFLPDEVGYEKTVIEAMNYSFLAGGKRLRPMLMLESYKIFGGDSKIIEPFMAALEMIHTYSLIHDDLPAMDNDEYRRGRKTTHVVYGEAMAILAGDGLLTYAFETAVKALEVEGSDAAKVVRAIRILANKAGLYGMLGGQCVDVEAEKKNLEVDEKKLVYIHEKKTAALIQAALMIGAVLAGADEQTINTMERIGFLVGVAFQIRDDILDVTGTLEELGKPIGSDEKNGKTTYITLKGLDEAKRDVEAYSEEAVKLCEALPGDTEFLTELVKSLCYRTK